MGNNKSMVFMGMGFELVILILGAAYLGRYVDEKLGWGGYATMGFIVLCMVSWFYHLVVLLKRVNDYEDKSNGG